MDKAQPPAQDVIFNTMKEIYAAIPDKDIVTVKQLREAVAEKLGLGSSGLDDNKDLCTRLLQDIINDREPQVQQESGAPEAAEPEAMPMTHQRAVAATTGLILRHTPKPRFVPYTEPNLGWEDLTIRDWHGRNPVKAVVDVILNYDGDIQEQHIKKCVIEGEMEDMPSIHRPPVGAIPVNHFTQTAFVKNALSKWTVVRFITFQSDGDDGKVKGQVAESHAHGTLYLTNFGPSKANKNGKKAFQYLFQELGGIQVRQWDLQSGSRAAAETLPDDAEMKAIDLGFAFIEKSFRDRTVPAHGIKQLHWVTRCLKDSSCPLYAKGDFHWTDGIIERALKKLAEEGCLAKVVTDCPYTLHTLAPWFVDQVLVKLVPHLHSRSFGLVGCAGVGKSPVIETLACVFSRYWKRKLGIGGQACFRSASDLDFFRGEVGTVDRPDALDDADPRTIPPAKWKAFGDVGLAEAMSRERWGASKWVKNQLRLWGFNPVDYAKEPQEGLEVTADAFFQLLQPLWHKDMDEESKMAVLKRSCVVVITLEWIYWRIANENRVPVNRLKFQADGLGSRSLVHTSAHDLVRAWKEGDSITFPENYEEQLVWEEQWMNAVMSKAALPIPQMHKPHPQHRSTARSADIAAVSQPLRGLAPESVIADVDGRYRIPLGPDVRTGSSLKRRFKEPLKHMSKTLFDFGESSSSSSTALPSASKSSATSALFASSSTSAPNQTSCVKSESTDRVDAALKRVKMEPGAAAVKTEPRSRIEKEAALEALRQQMSELQAELGSSPPHVKREPRDFGDDEDGFRVMVNALSKEPQLYTERNGLLR